MNTQDHVILMDNDTETPAPADVSDESILKNTDGTTTVFLKHPVSCRMRNRNGEEVEERYDSITFRRMTGGDVIAMSDITKDGEQIKMLLGRLALKTPITVFERMDIDDFYVCTEVIEGFLPQSLRAGRKS